MKREQSLYTKALPGTFCDPAHVQEHDRSSQLIPGEHNVADKTNK